MRPRRRRPVQELQPLGIILATAHGAAHVVTLADSPVVVPDFGLMFVHPPGYVPDVIRGEGLLYASATMLGCMVGLEQAQANRLPPFPGAPWGGMWKTKSDDVERPCTMPPPPAA